MNEAILKWLACATIGVVACGSLWLAGSVQHEIAHDDFLVGKASVSAQHNPYRRDVRLAARPVDRAASAIAVRTSFALD